MQKQFLLLAVSIVCTVNFLSAQEDHHHRNFTVNNSSPSIQPTSTGNSGTGANIDVVYNRIAWTVNPNDAGKNITGTVTIYFKTITAPVSTLSFDLNKTSFNNGSLIITYHGTTCAWSFPATGSVNIVNITLPVTIPTVNTLDSIVINYSGTPPAASGAAQGYQRTSYSDQMAVTQFYTNSLSESYEDRDWWPCKADMQDKIDSMDIQVTVPWSGADTFWVATNGRMTDSTIIGATRIFKFKTRYPIASYLVCLTVAKFVRYDHTLNLNGTNIPVVYNLLRGKTASYYTNAKTAMDKMDAVLLAFSSKFGDYPFKLEKHGFYDGLVGAGGMEHQTFSAIAPGSLTSLSTLAHELMHQWFGDNVTFATWNDLWLAEGFARYSESLAGELVPSLGINAHTSRTSMKSSALSNAVSAWIPNSNTSTSAGIWSSSYGSSVYVRGGMVVSMLRALAGDAKFFQACTMYQNSIKGKSATTDSLKYYFNQVLGTDISEFFNDYVGGSGPNATAVGGIGNPIYTINWNSPSTNKLVIEVATQAKSATNNVTYFNGPVVLHVTGASLPANDTTIIFYDWGGGNLSHAGNGLSLPIAGNRLSYILSFTPTAVAYDDSARTLSTGSTVPTAGLDNYTWFGTTSTAWNTTGNWSALGVPPSGADITIATVGSNQPILPGNITVGPLTINAANAVILNGNTLTLNNVIRGTGTLTGSATSRLTVAGIAGTINFTQTSSATRSLNILSVNSKCSATLGTGLMEIYGGLSLPPTSSLTVRSANLLIR